MYSMKFFRCSPLEPKSWSRPCTVSTVYLSVVTCAPPQQKKKKKINTWRTPWNTCIVLENTRTLLVLCFAQNTVMKRMTLLVCADNRKQWSGAASLNVRVRTSEQWHTTIKGTVIIWERSLILADEWSRSITLERTAHGADQMEHSKIRWADQ